MTPRTHYVYRVYDDQGLLLYVGCTKSPKARHRAHMAQRHGQRPWFGPYAARWIFTGPYAKDHAQAIEAQTIQDLVPVFNSRGLPGRGRPGVVTEGRPAIDAYIARRRKATAA